MLKLVKYRPNIIEYINKKEDYYRDFPDIDTIHVMINPEREEYNSSYKGIKCKNYIGTINVHSKNNHLDVYYCDNSDEFIIGSISISVSKLFSFYRFYYNSNCLTGNDNVIFYMCSYITYVRYKNVFYDTLINLPIKDFYSYISSKSNDSKLLYTSNIFQHVIINIFLFNSIKGKFNLHDNVALTCVEKYLDYVKNEGNITVRNVNDVYENMHLIKIFVLLGRYRINFGSFGFVNSKMAKYIYNSRNINTLIDKDKLIVKYINNNKEMILKIMRYVMTVNNLGKGNEDKHHLLTFFYNVVRQNSYNSLFLKEFICGNVSLCFVSNALSIPFEYNNNVRYIIETLILLPYVECMSNRIEYSDITREYKATRNPLCSNHVFYSRNMIDYTTKTKDDLIYIPKGERQCRVQYDSDYNDLYEGDVFGYYDEPNNLPQYYDMETVNNIMSSRRELSYSYTIVNNKYIVFSEMKLEKAEELYELLKLHYPSHSLTETLLSIIKEKKFYKKVKVNNLNKDNKIQLFDFYNMLFRIGMTVRRWTGGPYPMTVEETLPGAISEGDLDVTLTDMYQDLKKLIDNMKVVVKSFIKVNKCYNIKNGKVFRDVNVHGGYIFEIIKHVFPESEEYEKNSLCRRIASNIFISTSYYYMIKFFNHNFDNFNISNLQNIM